MIETLSASNFSLNQLSKIMASGFEGYFVPIIDDAQILAQRIRLEHIDLFDSLVILENNEPIGLAFIAKRGVNSRLATMCLALSARDKGIGKIIMKKIIDEAKNRGEKQMILEVIQQNQAAVKLYQHVGFKITRQLFGYTKEFNALQGLDINRLKEIDLEHFKKILLIESDDDLSWQLDPLTLASLTSANKVFSFGESFALIQVIEQKIILRAILTKENKRNNGLASTLISLIEEKFSGFESIIPAIAPENYDQFFVKNKFIKQNTSQFEMIFTF